MAQHIGWCNQADGIVLASAPATGTAAYIGRFEVQQTNCVNVATGAVTLGAATLTAANGDELYFSYTGQAVPGSALPKFHLFYIVIGGTGRFVNAEGQMDMWVTYTSASTFTSTGSGWLTYYASDRSAH